MDRRSERQIDNKTNSCHFLKSSNGVQPEYHKRTTVTVKFVPLVKMKTNMGGYVEVEKCQEPYAKWFSDDFRGYSNELICLNSINVRKKVWQRSLTWHDA